MTETIIANRALSLIGEPAISSLDDGTVAGRVIGLQYEVVRDSLLRSHPWDFAIERVELSREVDGPLFGWGYSFPLPSDCLRVIEFNAVDADKCSKSFGVEGDRLVTNSTSARIAYVKRVTDPSRFDAIFTDALTYRLAASVAKEITGSDSIAVKMEKEAKRRINEARFVDSNQGSVRVRVTGTGSRSLRGFADQEHVTTVKGETGSNGLSAYEVAVQNGFSGTVSEWLESLQAVTGPTTLKINGGSAASTFGDYLLRYDWGANGATINTAGTP
jgi:hypothetical protein